MLLEDSYKLQNNNNFKKYNSYDVLEHSDVKIKLKKMTYPTQYAAQYSLIHVDKSKWLSICLKSVGQSESSTWFKERHLRITCSSKAHQIKTRQNNYETLASAFVREKYKGKKTSDMLYGIEMEPIAASFFSETDRSNSLSWISCLFETTIFSMQSKRYT